MAAPEFVPVKPFEKPRAYESAPRRMDPWLVDRPGDFVGTTGQPDVDAGRMGSPGPDQGYALKLVKLIAPDFHLSESEHLEDAETIVVLTALKRASLFGRAPVIFDLRIAATVWGLFDAQAPKDLVAERVRRFEGARLVAHHYPEVREVVDAVPAETLRRTEADIDAAHRADWRSLLTL